MTVSARRGGGCRTRREKSAARCVSKEHGGGGRFKKRWDGARGRRTESAGTPTVFSYGRAPTKECAVRRFLRSAMRADGGGKIGGTAAADTSRRRAALALRISVKLQSLCIRARLGASAKNHRTDVRRFLYQYAKHIFQVSSRLSQLRNAWALMVLVTGMTVFAPQREQLTHMPSSVTSTV